MNNNIVIGDSQTIDLFAKEAREKGFQITEISPGNDDKPHVFVIKKTAVGQIIQIHQEESPSNDKVSATIAGIWQVL